MERRRGVGRSAPLVAVSVISLLGILGLIERKAFDVQERHTFVLPPDAASLMLSQGGQDKWLYKTHFAKHPLVNEGFFVEFGARNGKEHSNTYFFEHALGWSGILLEVLPSEQKEIAKNRPGSAVIDGGVCEYDGAVEILKHAFDGWGGRADTYDRSRSLAHPTTTTVTAACYRLDTLVKTFGVARINYMSVDTEGSELQALRSFPWRDVLVDFVAVEVLLGTPDRKAKEDELVAFMTSVGYKVEKDYVFADDTKDVFFRPALPGVPRAAVDRRRFREATQICRLLRRCLGGGAP